MERITKLAVDLIHALDGKGWIASPDLARMTGASRATLHYRLAQMTMEGLLERSETRPAHYRINPKLTKAQRAEIERIKRAAEVFYS